MKILVFGLPGSGKSTFAKHLTAETNIPHLMQMRLEVCLRIGISLKQVE
jgi:adenylate kinase family enzyme